MHGNVRFETVIVVHPLPAVEQIIDRCIFEGEMMQAGKPAEVGIVAKLRIAGHGNAVIGAVVAEKRDAGRMEHRLDADGFLVPVDHFIHARGLEQRVMEYRTFDRLGHTLISSLCCGCWSRLSTAWVARTGAGS